MVTATKKKRKEEAYPWKASASSGHTTNVMQSILRLSIYMVPILFKTNNYSFGVKEDIGSLTTTFAQKILFGNVLLEKILLENVYLKRLKHSLSN
jgi:hypothetical protein